MTVTQAFLFFSQLIAVDLHLHRWRGDEQRAPPTSRPARAGAPLHPPWPAAAAPPTRHTLIPCVITNSHAICRALFLSFGSPSSGSFSLYFSQRSRAVPALFCFEPCLGRPFSLADWIKQLTGTGREYMCVRVGLFMPGNLATWNRIVRIEKSVSQSDNAKDGIVHAASATKHTANPSVYCYNR